MNVPTLCPFCLDELPDGYEFDHVAIDLALEGHHRVYREERAEAVRVGLTRGMSPAPAADFSIDVEIAAPPDRPMTVLGHSAAARTLVRAPPSVRTMIVPSLSVRNTSAPRAARSAITSALGWP